MLYIGTIKNCMDSHLREFLYLTQIIKTNVSFAQESRIFTTEDDRNARGSTPDGEKEQELEEEERAEDEMNDAAESDSAVPVTTDESFAAEETFHSDDDFFKDAVATEADQHKSVTIHTIIKGIF